MKKKIVQFSIITFIFLLILIKVNTLIAKEKNEVYSVPPQNVAIALNYHRIRENNLWNKSIEFLTQAKEFTTYSVYKDTFEKQLDTLIENGAYFATPSELAKFSETGKYPKNCVWISFDDAEKSVYDIAFPILKERNIPFTVFVISSKVGSKDYNNLEMASWDNLREMRDSGLVTFGSHTHNMHYLEDDRAVFLDSNNYREFEKDIKLSKITLEKELNVKINSIAYPFGDTNDDITEITKNSGFEYAYLLSPNPITKDDSPYYQNRYLIDKNNFDKILIPWLTK